MKTNKQFENLEIWELSRQLNLNLYQILLNVDSRENGFLKNHILKTAGSIMDNIAEGFEREGNKEFIQFLYISKGSAGELRSQLLRLYDFNVISMNEKSELTNHVRQISSQISLFIKYLNRTDITGNKYK